LRGATLLGTNGWMGSHWQPVRMMTSFPHRIVFAGYGFVTACSAANAGSVLPLDGGRYGLECPTSSLRECLARAEAVCDSGYQVLEAGEGRRRVGVQPVASEYTESRAIFICGGNSAKPEAPVAPPSAPPPSAPSPGTCLPGASKACVGPGGCSGGQVCLADGKALGACDCGAPTTDAPQPR